MSDRAGESRRRALLSVSDKRGLTDFARGLVEHGFELVSTGGTARAMRDAELEVTDVATVTGAPEMLGGRVKTLHPRIAAGVLADQHDPVHVRQLAEQDIEPFELVCVNLYRFEEAAARAGTTDAELIEEIDIGGPTLVRAAAKNHASVAIVSDPDDYDAVLAAIAESGSVPDDMRRHLALKAYRLTASYDAVIAATLAQRWSPDERFPESLTLPLRRAEQLRYGENPHQAAALYTLPMAPEDAGLLATGARLLAGKPLSYNNLLDAAAVSGMTRDLDGHAVVIVKHGNPCGAAEADTLEVAWERALAGDPVSAFGGVVGIRGIVGAALAEALTSIFLEVVVAAGFDEAAREVLASRPSLRLLEDPALMHPPSAGIVVRSAAGGMLVSDADAAPDDPATWRVVSAREPDDRERADLAFAWRIVKHVSSNAIVLVRGGALVGVGAGQMSRVEAAELAVKHAAERAQGSVCASDAFFPFPDAAQACLDAGVTAIVQPGGSRGDDDVVAAADAAGASMLFTGVRHFRH